MREEEKEKEDMIVGHFGSRQLQQGVWRWGKMRSEVALKRQPLALEEEEEAAVVEVRIKFLQEAVTLAQFRHPNVTMLYGLVITREPVRC